MNRRSALKLLASTAALPLLPSSPLLAKATAELTPADSVFLDDLQRRACMFFFEQASPTTGQVLDRARAGECRRELTATR